MTKKDALTRTTEAAMEKLTAGMSAQADLAKKIYGLYQAQTEKALAIWMDAASNAMAEGEKAMKEWVDLGTQVTADARKTCEESVKDATKLFAPAA
jgi:hypothetical protein